MTDPEDSPPALRAKVTELRASKYYLECEKSYVRTTLKIYEARIGGKPKELLTLYEEQRTVQHDAQVANAALKKAQAEYASVLERERDRARDETAKAAGGED